MHFFVIPEQQAGSGSRKIFYMGITWAMFAFKSTMLLLFGSTFIASNVVALIPAVQYRLRASELKEES